MTNINFLNRDNHCEMEGVCIEDGRTLHRSAARFPCFHAAFEFVTRHSNQTYDITYKLHMNKHCNGQYNNFVVLSKADMMRLLNSVKHVIPFKYHFIDKPNCYVLKMSLVGTSLQHRGLLMLSRMLFEYPHNLCAADALKIKQQGHLDDVSVKNLTLLNLYTLCLSSAPWYSTDESIISGQSPEMMQTKKFQRALKSKAARLKKVSKVIPGKAYRTRTFEKWGNTLEEAISEENFESRLETYSINLKHNLNA
jgi:hypothetical protein